LFFTEYSVGFYTVYECSTGRPGTDFNRMRKLDFWKSKKQILPTATEIDRRTEKPILTFSMWFSISFQLTISSYLAQVKS
jgi:hypothetical protein